MDQLLLLNHWFDSMPLLLQRHVFETDFLISNTVLDPKLKIQREFTIAVGNLVFVYTSAFMPLYALNLDLLELSPLPHLYNMLVGNIYVL